MSIREILHLFDIGKITVSLCNHSLEIARDNFAIEFAEWYKNKGDYYEYETPIEGVLEIYKKEKGL